MQEEMWNVIFVPQGFNWYYSDAAVHLIYALAIFTVASKTYSQIYIYMLCESQEKLQDFQNLIL